MYSTFQACLPGGFGTKLQNDGLIRQKHLTISIDLLIYANRVFNKGIDEFYNQCEKTSIDSILIAERAFRILCHVKNSTVSSVLVAT
ncbi:tryptophan synthase subunit alpha (plasmid) [Escherichia albertii]|nr:tryptophan synthase subunit alpha [Escherichia albertii]QST40187.1 tryptophan synthase subunit alpha [Escherichia albertii]